MGTETVAIMACTLPDIEKPNILPRFLEVGAAELCNFRESERARWERSGRPYNLDFDASIGGFWCLGDENFFDMFQRECEVTFELDVGVRATVDRKSFYFWTSIRESLFLENPREQTLVRRLSRCAARIVGADKAIYVPDCGDEISLTQEMVTNGATFEEIVAFASTICAPLPAPPVEGLNLYASYPDVVDPYFIDDFANSEIWNAA